MKKLTLKIEGMNCGHCSNAVKNLAEEIEGVSANVDLENNLAEVEFDENTTTSQAIIDNINSTEIYKAIAK